MKEKAHEIRLRSTKFDQIETFSLGLNFEYLILGPFPSLYYKRYFEFFSSLVLTFLTFGVYWLLFAFKVNKIIIRRKINQGYIPFSDQDKEVIEILMQDRGIIPSSIGLSRLESVDGKS